jgi:hypothetical protein
MADKKRDAPLRVTTSQKDVPLYGNVPPQLAISSSSASVSVSPQTVFTDQDLFFPAISEGGYQRLNDDHPVYHLIGRVTAEWSHLEHVLDRILWHLLGVKPEQAACVTGQLIGTGPRYRAIIAQLTYLKIREPNAEKYIGRVNKLNDAIHGPQEKRNRIVHDEWFADHREEQLAQFRAWPAKDLRFGISPVLRAEIESTVVAIRKLTDRAEQLFKDIRAHIKAPVAAIMACGDAR